MAAKPCILVLGAGGQVGSELLERAADRAVIGLNRNQLDICDASAVAAALNKHQPAIIINAAAYTAVDRAEAEADLAYAINAQACATLAEQAAALGIPLLHISTDYVFDGQASRAYKPADAANPQSVYGETKWQGEQRIRERLPEHIILRVSWVFGAHGHNFVKTMLRLADSHPSLSIVGDQQGAPTHAGAIAECLLTLCDRYFEHGSLPWGSWHFSGSPATTWFDFAQRIFELALPLGLIERIPELKRISTAEYPTPAARPMNSRLDLSVSQQALQFTPVRWEDGLHEMLQQLARSADSLD